MLVLHGQPDLALVERTLRGLCDVYQPYAPRDLDDPAENTGRDGVPSLIAFRSIPMSTFRVFQYRRDRDTLLALLKLTDSDDEPTYYVELPTDIDDEDEE